MKYYSFILILLSIIPALSLAASRDNGKPDECVVLTEQTNLTFAQRLAAIPIMQITKGPVDYSKPLKKHGYLYFPSAEEPGKFVNYMPYSLMEGVPKTILSITRYNDEAGSQKMKMKALNPNFPDSRSYVEFTIGGSSNRITSDMSPIVLPPAPKVDDILLPNGFEKLNDSVFRTTFNGVEFIAYADAQDRLSFFIPR